MGGSASNMYRGYKAMVQLRILVADDHEVVRRALRALLEAQAGWKVIGEAVNGSEAVEQAERLQPDMVILDINMPKLDGLSAARKIRQATPQAELLVLTQHDAPQLVHIALDTGVRGYVLKSDAGHDLVAAVEALSRHQLFISPKH